MSSTGAMLTVGASCRVPGRGVVANVSDALQNAVEYSTRAAAAAMPFTRNTPQTARHGIATRAQGSLRLDGAP